jgi:hypothetical protein
MQKAAGEGKGRCDAYLMVDVAVCSVEEERELKKRRARY